MRVISPRAVSGALSVSMSATSWEIAGETLILLPCLRFHGGRGRIRERRSSHRQVLRAPPGESRLWQFSGGCFGPLMCVENTLNSDRAKVCHKMIPFLSPVDNTPTGGPSSPGSSYRRREGLGMFKRPPRRSGKTRAWVPPKGPSAAPRLWLD